MVCMASEGLGGVTLTVVQAPVIAAPNSFWSWFAPTSEAGLL